MGEGWEGGSRKEGERGREGSKKEGGRGKREQPNSLFKMIPWTTDQMPNSSAPTVIGSHYGDCYLLKPLQSKCGAKTLADLVHQSLCSTLIS